MSVELNIVDSLQIDQELKDGAYIIWRQQKKVRRWFFCAGTGCKEILLHKVPDTWKKRDVSQKHAMFAQTLMYRLSYQEGTEYREFLGFKGVRPYAK